MIVLGHFHVQMVGPESLQTGFLTVSAVVFFNIVFEKKRFCCFAHRSKIIGLILDELYSVKEMNTGEIQKEYMKQDHYNGYHCTQLQRTTDEG